ncbi:ABC transporter substrate-binding protein, partial [Pseudomonas aeruginosa]
MSTSKTPFVRGYDGLSVQRQIAQRAVVVVGNRQQPLHVSQSHLPDSQVERHACVFCDDFALITEGQNVPPELDAQCPSHGIARNLVYTVMAEEAGQPLHGQA